MCEYCNNGKPWPTDRKSAPRPIRAIWRPSGFGSSARNFFEATSETAPETETPEAEARPENQLSEAGRDVLGLLRISANLGTVAEIKPLQLKFLYMLLDVPVTEQAIIAKIMQPLEHKKQTSPEDAMIAAFMNAMTGA